MKQLQGEQSQVRYEDLTIIQKIGLKGFFVSDPAMKQYRLIWIMWDFKVAIEYFLTGDLNQIVLKRKP